MESSSPKRGEQITVLPIPDKNKEMFLRVVKAMMRPYMVETLFELKMEKLEDKIEAIEERLLEKFWNMSQTDMQISMAMIPIMAYIKKADRKIQMNQSYGPK